VCFEYFVVLGSEHERLRVTGCGELNGSPPAARNPQPVRSRLQAKREGACELTGTECLMEFKVVFKDTFLAGLELVALRPVV